MVHENDYVARHAPREREKPVCRCSDWRARDSRDRVRGERRATRRSLLLSPSRCMRRQLRLRRRGKEVEKGVGRPQVAGGKSSGGV